MICRCAKCNEPAESDPWFDGYCTRCFHNPDGVCEKTSEPSVPYVIVPFGRTAEKKPRARRS